MTIIEYAQSQLRKEFDDAKTTHDAGEVILKARELEFKELADDMLKDLCHDIVDTVVEASLKRMFGGNIVIVHDMNTVIIDPHCMAITHVS